MNTSEVQAGGHRTPDIVEYEHRGGNDIVQRLASGRVLVIGEPAEKLSAARLRELGRGDLRPVPSGPRPDVRVNPRDLEDLPGELVMAVARGTMTPQQARDHWKAEQERLAYGSTWP